MRGRPLLLLFLLQACTSWQSHINNHLEDNGNLRKLEAESPPPQDYTDTIAGKAVMVEEWHDAEGRLYARKVKWPEKFFTDTIYYANGEFHSIRERQMDTTMPYAMQYDRTHYYDRKGRPVYFYNSYYEKGSLVEYRQFYTKEGKLLPEKHEVIYEILRPSR